MNFFQSKSARVAFYSILLIQLILVWFYVFYPALFPPEGQKHLVVVGDLFYPNIIQQSKDGAWRIIESHTTLFTPRVFAYTFFVLLGKIAAMFSLDPPWVFLYAKILFGIVYFYTVAWCLTRLLPTKYHLLSIILALGIESGPILTRLPSLEVLWEARVLFLRNFGLPHHRLAHATGLIFIVVLLYLTQKITVKRVLALIVSGTISVVSMPGFLFTFAVCTFPVWFLWSFLAKSVKRITSLLTLAGTIIVIPNIFFMLEFRKGHPWINSTTAEREWFTTQEVQIEYLSSLFLYVPLLLLFFFILPNLYRHADRWRRQLIVVLLSWLLLPFFWTIIAEFSWFPMPDHRLTDSHGYIPAAILGTLTCYYCWERLKTSLGKVIFVAFLFLSTIFPSLILSVYFTKQQFEGGQIYHRRYASVSQSLWDGIQFIKTLPKGSGILVREQLGDILPMYANVRTYVGGTYNHWDYQYRAFLAGRFFSGTMNEVPEFLSNNDIQYVFYGPEEKAINKTGMLYDDQFEVIFTNSDVTIFKLKSQLQ